MVSAGYVLQTENVVVSGGVDGEEALGERASGQTCQLGHTAEPGPEVGLQGGRVGDLALVAAQGAELAVEHVGDVSETVGLVGPAMTQTSGTVHAS